MKTVITGKNKKRKGAAIVSFLLFAVLFPMTVSAQLSDASIKAAHEYSQKGAGLGMIVWENGRVRFEDYYAGHSAGKPLHIYSGTKSFFGVLAAIGVEEGWLDLDEPVGKTLSSWREDPRKRRITIRQLLNFTSGLETGFSQIYGRSSVDKVTASTTLDVTREPGTTFVYGPGHLQVFCAVIREKLKKRGQSYEGYLRKKLISPLGISIPKWREDAHGNVIPSAGMYMTGRDWLKFGEMVAQGGRWKNKQLIKTESLRLCFTGTRINPAYGINFWLNGYAGQSDARVADVEQWLDRDPMPEDWSGACLSKNAPPDLVAALGSNFQRLYIVPSMQLVVVHLGSDRGKFTDDQFLTLLFQNTANKVTAKPTVTKRDTRPLLPRILFGKKKKKP